jgi:hypothetical protein
MTEEESDTTCSVCKKTDCTFVMKCLICKCLVCEFCELLYCAEGYHAAK